jgi:hypothetical protein
MAIDRDQNWLRTLIRAVWWPDTKLTAEESASTLFRFFRSEHVRDLKAIVALAVFSLIIIVVLVLAFGAMDATLPASPGRGVPVFERLVRFFEFLAKYCGPAFAVAGLVVGWAYRSAAARLGVVDLFACEISTLCRVGTIVDVGERYVADYARETHHAESGGKEQAISRPTMFVAQEDYFPVFQTNAKDLELLEALVVNNITEFYTYMKATRDSQRRLAQLSSFGSEAGLDPRLNLIYMLFLAYESGRKAVESLIEFQPSRAENRIVILITELKCYSCLLKHLDQDKHHYPRLLLRKEDYRNVVPTLYKTVVHVAHGMNEQDWVQAKAIAPELRKRYEEAFDEDMDAALARLHSSDRELHLPKAEPSLI